MSTPPEEALALSPEDLQAQYPESLLPASTAEIAPLDRFAGQDRALEALAFGTEIDGEGYHIAVSGPPSSGRTTAAENIVREMAATRQPAGDWCYLHNFDDPYRPRAVALPPGLGADLKRELEQLIESCSKELPLAFESETYHDRIREALTAVQQQREQLLANLEQTAAQQGFVVNMTQMGIAVTPRGQDGAPMRKEDFAQLPRDMRQLSEKRGEAVQEQVRAVTQDLRRLDVQAREALHAVNQEVVRFTVGPILDDLRHKFPQSELRRHFDGVERDLLENVGILRGEDAPQQMMMSPVPQEDRREALLHRYAVNLFVTHGDDPPQGAPVIHERQPTYSNLFGRSDYQPRYGVMMTDFLQIHPGAIHGANGGFLIMQAEDLLGDPRSWLKLKRSLKNKEIRMEDVSEVAMPLPVVHLVPEPIPLELKVILIGSPMIFATLAAYDPDFANLFKVRAEFEPDMPQDETAIRAYAAFVRRSCDMCELRQFDREALIEVLRFGSRLAGRRDRLVTQFGTINDLCQEANQVAKSVAETVVRGSHVRAAIDGMRRRSGLVPDRLRQMIVEGSRYIETSGRVVGQVNGLAVYQVGANAFGTPTRISCRTGSGTLGVVNIEREVERSGAIHTKGVLVLSGFLMGTFGARSPLSFSASLTFEQSYDEVDGDSASSAELYAILTSLAGIPIRQDIAVTGSVDQFGRIQPVGGVTEKVEGFFDLCEQVGMSGSQGVMIPSTNVVNLTLRDDVVRAVAEGRFRIWSVSRVEEGLEVLTGISAGVLGKDGTYPEDTIFRRVVDTLAAMQPAMGWTQGTLSSGVEETDRSTLALPPGAPPSPPPIPGVPRSRP